MLFKKFNLQLFADDDSSTSEDGKKSEQQALCPLIFSDFLFYKFSR